MSTQKTIQDSLVIKEFVELAIEKESNMSLNGVKLEYVNSVEKAEEFLSWLGQRRPILAIDSETMGLEWYKGPGFTRLVQFGDSMTGYTIALQQWRGVIEIALQRLRENNVRIAMHNANFDMHALAIDNLPLPKWQNVDDTKVFHHLLAPHEGHHLKGLANRLIDPSASLGQEMLEAGMKRNGWTWATVPLNFEPYTLYAGLDTVLTSRLHEKFSYDVSKRFWVPYQREMICQEVMWGAETRGIHIDWKYATQLRESYREEMERLQYELDAYGIRNPSSGRQIEAALRDEGWEPDEFTPTGQAKTSEEVLKGIDSDIVPKVIRFKRLRKWMVAYLEHFINERDAFDCVHPSINSLQAKTGRMSITRPPLQTLPKGKEIRDCVTAREGMELYAIDYENVELRLAAALSKDDFLISAFMAGVDMHDDLAQRTFGEDFTPKQRGLAKAGRYANLYGAGIAKLARTLGIEQEYAVRLIDGIQQASPSLVKYAEEVSNEGALRLQTEGVAYTDTWGGRIAVAESDKIYKLLNAKIQGTAVDLFKEAIATMWKKDLDQYIVVPVHDENLLETPVGGEEIIREIHKIMEVPNEFIVPLTCSISGPAQSWGGWYGS